LVLFQETIRSSLDNQRNPKKTEQLAKRQANSALALLKMGRPEKLWPLLVPRPDPRVRSYLIHRLGPLAMDAKPLLRRLAEEEEGSIRRALLLSLGGFGPDQLSLADKDQLLPEFIKMYREDPDPGIHGAVEWLLRHW